MSEHLTVKFISGVTSKLGSAQGIVSPSINIIIIIEVHYCTVFICVYVPDMCNVECCFDTLNVSADVILTHPTTCCNDTSLV